MNTKLQYFTSSLKKKLLFRSDKCPSCGCDFSKVIERKYIVTDLRRCGNCSLLFRTPTTSHEENQRFYQTNYTQGFTTQVPDESQLNHYLETDFAGSDNDFKTYLRVLEAAGVNAGASLLDYGCSWGYGSWQFATAGYDVTAFEISQPRCEFARTHLKVDAKNSLVEVQGYFDVIFSSHVIEHLPSVSEFLTFCHQHLKPNGLLITVTPNGSEAFRRLNRRSYKQLWGLVHPQLLDELFYKTYFKNKNLFLTSTPFNYEALIEWDQQSLFVDSVEGHELLCIWRNNI